MNYTISKPAISFALAAIIFAVLIACNFPGQNPEPAVTGSSKAAAFATKSPQTAQISGTPELPINGDNALTPILMEGLVTPCTSQSGLTSCEPRNISGINIFQPNIAGAMFGYELPTIEQILERGLGATGASPTHIIVTASTLPDTVRCNWRNLAMTANQRADAIRVWLDYPEDEPLPTAATIAADFNAFVDLLAPQFQDSMRANFMHLSYGGVFTEGLTLTCYADFAVTYFLGDGPRVITIAYDHLAKTRSYNLYQKAHAAGRYGADALLTAAEYAARDQAVLDAARQQLSNAFTNRGSLIFLAPMAAHYSIAVEAWQAIAQWDLQRQGDTTYAVRYGAGPGDTDYSVPLDIMRARITKAVNSDAHAGRRIATIAGLNAYYRDRGAYGNIAAPGQPAVMFTPALPPAPPGVPAPTNLRAQSTRTAVTISWHGVSSWATTGYRILRRVANRETDFTTLVANTARPATTYTDNDVRLGQTYIYRVQAVGPTAASPASARITASPGPLPTPQNATATATRNSVTLTWNRQGWDALDIAAITGYRIIRRTPGEPEFAEVGATDAATFAYTDQAGIQPNTRYIYRIEAVADSGSSAGARAAARTAG